MTGAGIMMCQTNTNLGSSLKLRAFRLDKQLPSWGTARHAENGPGDSGISARQVSGIYY